MGHTHARVISVVRDALRGLNASGKPGRELLQLAISSALSSAGNVADQEDFREFLGRGMYPWRNKDTGLAEPTADRRRIDIVVYGTGSPVALIETESDLEDLRAPGIVNRRNGHYDVHSLASNAAKAPFKSYKSLERMASGELS